MEGVPSPLAVEYYRQRASAGLIISEAISVSQKGRGYAFKGRQLWKYLMSRRAPSLMSPRPARRGRSFPSRGPAVPFPAATRSLKRWSMCGDASGCRCDPARLRQNDWHRGGSLGISMRGLSLSRWLGRNLVTQQVSIFAALSIARIGCCARGCESWAQRCSDWQPWRQCCR